MLVVFVVPCHLQMKDEASDGNKAAAEAAAQRGNLLMNALWSIVGGGRAAESAGEPVQLSPVADKVMFAPLCSLVQLLGRACLYHCARYWSLWSLQICEGAGLRDNDEGAQHSKTHGF